MLEQVSDDIDLQQLLLDSTIIPVHQHGAGAKKEGPPAIGRSPGGLTTKIDSAVDALGNPLGSILTAGQDSDIIQAPTLIEGLDPDMVIAD